MMERKAAEREVSGSKAHKEIATKRRILGLPAGAIVLAVIAAYFVYDAAAQQPGVQFAQFGRRIPGQTDPDKEVIEGVFLPVDRETTRQLEVAKDALGQDRYSDAATVLDGILQRSEDYFFKPDEDKPTHRSLKAEAQRLIGGMPEEGLNAYELQFGARAQQMLQEAAAGGDVPRLEEIARRFFHTKAGNEATLLLGRHHQDHGRPLAAAFCFARLQATPDAAASYEPALSLMLATSWLQSGMPERASEVLAALKKSNPKVALRIGDKTLNMPADDAKAVPWLLAAVGNPRQAQPAELEHWALFRGNPARNAVSAGGSPLLNPRWRVPTTNHPALEKALAGIRQRYLEQGVAALPGMHPLAVGDVVLMRTARDLLAVDFNTGKRIWEVRPPGDSSLERLISSSGGSGQFRFDPQQNPGLTERFWDDATFGTLASDGQQVYLIEDLGFAAGGGSQRIVINANGQRRPGTDGPKLYNKLSARELRTQGKLKWEIGGQSGEDEPQLAGAFFLGPPLPLQGKLYVLAEVKGEIKLCVLDAKTGRQEWSQQLAVVEQNITQDPFRRLAGSTPSFADGVLVCPTSAGAVVAVDLSNRSLLWGFQYPRNQPMMQNAMAMMRMGGGVWMNGQFVQGGGNATERWTDAAATIADGRVIVTPVESNELHCLSLLDGKLLWKKERGENLYLACVHNGNAVLVGKRQVAAYKMADGNEAWKSKAVDLPSTAMPSGRGFLSGEQYYLPLTTAEVARIDLAAGKITARAKSRKGNIPGNLICYQGEVVSQGVDFLETFFQLEPLQARIAKVLDEKPKDAWALAHRGEIALDEGRLPEAIADIRSSHQSDANPFTRDLLIEALLTALGKDFAKHREALPELDTLVKLESERSAYLRVLAAGLHKSGETLGALDAYLKLAAMEAQPEEMEDLDAALSVRRDRWIRAQFNGLFDDAGPADRAKIEAAVQEKLAAAIAAKGAKPLRQFLAFFGDHALGDQARLALVDQIGGPEAQLEREQLLRRLEQSTDAAQRKTAMAKLAALLRDADRADEALAYYARIQKEFGDEPVLGDKNVKQLIAALPPDAKLRKVDAVARNWPEGKVVVDKQSPRSRSPQNYMRAFPMDLRGVREPFFQDVTVSFDQQRQDIVGRDGLGNERFRVSLNEGGKSRGYAPNPSLNYAVSHGHLLVVCMGFQVFGIDTLRPSGTAGNRILWTHDLSDMSPQNPYGYNGLQVRQVAMPWGAPRFVATVQNQQLGNVGACTENGVCVQRARDVSSIDPITGKTLWVRHGMTPGSDIFGDDELVVLAPPDGGEAVVLRAIDGELLGKRKVPPSDQRWITSGRNVLAWRNNNEGKLVLAMHDVWGQKEVWSEVFQPGAKGTIVNGEAVAVLEPSGKFVCINLADGAKTIDEKLEPEQNLQTIQVLRSIERDILITNRPFTANKPNRNIQSPFGDMYSPMVNGRVYAFDRVTGKPSWATPATVEQHGLVLGQGSELPVLVFIRNSHTAVNNRAQLKGEVLCLDKRTGRLIDESELSQMISSFEATANLEEKTVTLNTPVQNIVLRYTTDPVPPEPPFQAGLFEKPPTALEKNPAGVLIKAIGRAANPGQGIVPGVKIQLDDPFGAPAPDPAPAVEVEAVEVDEDD